MDEWKRALDTLLRNASRLLLDPKFWFALYAVAQLVVMHLFPQVTLDTWKVIDGLVALIIASMTGTQAVVLRIRTARLRAKTQQ